MLFEWFGSFGSFSPSVLLLWSFMVRSDSAVRFLQDLAKLLLHRRPQRLTVIGQKWRVHLKRPSVVETWLPDKAASHLDGLFISDFFPCSKQVHMSARFEGPSRARFITLLHPFHLRVFVHFWSLCGNQFLNVSLCGAALATETLPRSTEKSRRKGKPQTQRYRPWIRKPLW